MNVHFDLVDEPWLPCIRPDGTERQLGLYETLAQAHESLELHGETPLETAALHRLLLAVLHRVVDGPRSAKAWARLWARGRWDEAALRAYFEQWRDRFDLFEDTHPFYQSPDKRVKPKSLNSLAHQVASGNNPTLFDHHTDDEGIVLTPAEAARMLVTDQAFGLAGLSGLTQKFTDGTCASGITFLVQGQTLFETLMLNLVRYTDESPIAREPQDVPSWEMDDPFTPVRTVPLGYLDYLTWQNRRILLMPAETPQGTTVRQMTMAPALRLDNSVENPMMHYRRDEKRGAMPLSFFEGKALWRDSSALFELHNPGQSPPIVMHWLAELVYGEHLSRSQHYRCLALGMSKKQAKVYFFRQEQIPLHLSLLPNDPEAEHLRELLRNALSTASRTGGALREAGRDLARWIVSPNDKSKAHKDDVQPVFDQLDLDRRYWPRLEVSFQTFIRDLPGKRQAALDRWVDVVCNTARQAFDEAADGVVDPTRGLKALTLARGTLERLMARALNPKQA
jgi:CRISPR system Cascade subunit CasA